MVPQQNPQALGAVATGSTAQDPRSGGALSQAPGQLDLDHPLRPLVACWLEKLRLADEYKKVKWQNDANDCMAFFCGPYDFMYQKKYAAQPGGGFVVNEDAEDDLPAPTFQMTVNKVSEAVQIFGPALYHRNPVRQVNPRVIPEVPPELFGDPMNPQAQMLVGQAQAQTDATRTLDRLRSTLLGFYLNYTPTELDLKTHSRRGVDEGIIKGLGVLWTEVYQPKGAPFKLVGSFYDSADNFLCDPDMETIEDAWWVARRCTHPVWQVEREYGLAAGSLQGNVESSSRQSEVNTSVDGGYDRRRGVTNDLLCYWKVWSKMGIGGRLQGAPENLRAVLEQFGDYCYLVIAENVPYPLNLPPEALAAASPDAAESILARLDWPTPFWAADEWPVSPLIFHEVPRCCWPMSHMKPAMGELKFLNWAYSFLASKIRVTCRDFIAIQKGVDEELKDAILHGKDLTLLEINAAHGTIDKVVQFLSHPPFQGDIWKVIEAVTHNFEQRTGLSELLYGETASQMRSAEEANLKGDQMQIRPDDMAQKVEDWMTAVARKEALAARWHLGPQDVQTIMGPVAAQFWGRYVNGADLYEIVRQLDYRIEAGSAKKPNKARDASNAQQAMQALLQPLYQYASATGNVGPFNALVQFWGKALDLDVGGMTLAPPPPPPPPAGPPAGGPRPQPAGPPVPPGPALMPRAA